MLLRRSFFQSSMMRLPAATLAARVVGPSGFSVEVDGKMELAEVVGEKDMIFLLVAGGLCWSESFLEHKVTTEGVLQDMFLLLVVGGLCWSESSLEHKVTTESVLPDPGLVDAMKHWMSECAFSKFLGDGICSSRSAAAITVAEAGGHFPAAAFPRSEARLQNPPPLSAKKEEKFRFFVKTVEGKTKVFNSKEGDTVLSLLEAVEGAVEDSYVLRNGKILSLNQSLKGYGRDSTFRICARIRGGSTRRPPPPDIPGRWTCGNCFQERVWPKKNKCFRWTAEEFSSGEPHYSYPEAASQAAQSEGPAPAGLPPYPSPHSSSAGSSSATR